MKNKDLRQKPKTKKQMILDYLLSGRTLSVIEALEFFDTLHLSRTISDLKKEGYCIDKRIVHVDTGNWVAYYFISDKERYKPKRKYNGKRNLSRYKLTEENSVLKRVLDYIIQEKTFSSRELMIKFNITPSPYLRVLRHFGYKFDGKMVTKNKTRYKVYTLVEVPSLTDKGLRV